MINIIGTGIAVVAALVAIFFLPNIRALVVRPGAPQWENIARQTGAFGVLAVIIILFSWLASVIF